MRYDSIFISSVLNSVPYREDREKIVVILAALSNVNTITYAWTMRTNHQSHKNIFTDGLSDRASNEVRFLLDYEDNIVIGDISRKPKAQKDHSAKELHELFSTAFANVKVERIA